LTVTYRRIPSTDPRLGRHVRHDSRSREYAFPTAGLSLMSTKHTRRIPVLDQGQVGSCTGNAGVGCLGTDPYYDTLANVIRVYTFGEEGARRLYSDAETIDGDGPYPPNDNGSTGLSVAKALVSAGEISGYQHTFTLDDALLALTKTPYITGTTWLKSMFNPGPDGVVTVDWNSGIAGAHEYVADEIDVEDELVWYTQSWGPNWGVTRDSRPGRFAIRFTDVGKLLADQGDVTIFTPLTQPAPIPTPVPPSPTPTPTDPDAALAAVAHPWVREHHSTVGGNRHMQDALKTWLTAKGL